MNWRRFVAASIVALAVLFSQGGGLVLAAICPHLRAEKPKTACHTASPDVAAAHHQPVEANGDAFETQEHDIRCNHCVVHSRNKREEFALQQPNTTQRADDHNEAVPLFKVESPSYLKSVAWSASAQGPPGPAAPLHVLLNVFRI